MKSLLIAGAIVGAAAFAGAVPASASVFDLSFSGTGISGLLVLDLGGGSSPYTAVAIDSGSYIDIGGTTYAITGLTTYAGDDQRAFFPAGLHGFVDFAGISASFGSGDSLNLFGGYSPTGYGVLLKSQNTEGNPFVGPYYQVTVTDAPPRDPTPVPELSTWAMLGLGFAGLAFVAAGRRKTPIAALG